MSYLLINILSQLILRIIGKISVSDSLQEENGTTQAVDITIHIKTFLCRWEPYKITSVTLETAPKICNYRPWELKLSDASQQHPILSNKRLS